MWQKCPVCDGKGKTPAHVHPHYGNTSACSEVTCDVCSGRKIISTITGLPPALTFNLSQEPSVRDICLPRVHNHLWDALDKIHKEKET